MPEWIPTREFRTWPRGGKGESRLVDFPLVNSAEALLGMVQMHCIDMKAWYSRADRPDRLDYVVFDLDPPDGDDGFPMAVRVAQLIRVALGSLDLRSYVKTSGADGIHVLVPIARRSTYAETYEFAELLSRALEAEHPGEADDRVAEAQARAPGCSSITARTATGRPSPPPTRCGPSPALPSRRPSPGRS